jgi:hypothetical protein
MTKRLLLFVSVIVSIMVLVACGGAAERDGGQGVAMPQATMAAMEPESEKVAVEAVEVEVAEEASEDMAAAPADSSTSGSSGLAAPLVPQADRMIIKNADMSLLVSDTDVALDSVTVIATDYGGYIISSHTWFEDEHKFATVRLGVPVTEFENVLRRLRGLALKVQSEVAAGEDVTDQFVDLKSRLTNLEATRDRIREFLDKAENVEEALQVNEQLSQVEAQIEEIQGRMNYLKDRAAFSTINVELNPEIPTPTPSPTPTPTPTPTPEAWRPGETVQSATNVLVSLVKGLVEVGIWVVVILGPFLIPLALIIGFIVWLRRRRKKETPPEKPPTSEPPPATDA